MAPSLANISQGMLVLSRSYHAGFDGSSIIIQCAHFLL
jgi:hypothetical protein